MNLREVYIEKDKTLADSGNLVTELAVVDPVSEIQLRFKAKNYSDYNKNAPPARCISKIEIVDGADVLYSLDGMLAQAMSYYQTGRVPSMQRQAGPSENQEDHIVIRFGRSLWDKVFALVPNKFRNLQIKISWDLAKVRAVGAAGYLTGSAKLSIIARLMEGLEAEPAGFLMAKKHYDWTTAASGDERIPLPTDYPYVLMLLRAWEAEVKLYTTIANLKLSIDQDKDIPFDLASWDFLKMMENHWGKFILDQHIFSAGEENIQSWLGVGETAVLIPEGQDAVGATAGAIDTLYGVDSGHLNLKVFGNDGQAKAACIHQLLTIGQGLHHTFAYPFGLMEDPTSWLDAPGVGDIKAIITQGNAGAAADLALLQARAYK